jgi:hypothetical protein
MIFVAYWNVCVCVYVCVKAMCQLFNFAMVKSKPLCGDCEWWQPLLKGSYEGSLFCILAPSGYPPGGKSFVCCLLWSYQNPLPKPISNAPHLSYVTSHAQAVEESLSPCPPPATIPLAKPLPPSKANTRGKLSPTPLPIMPVPLHTPLPHVAPLHATPTTIPLPPLPNWWTIYAQATGQIMNGQA